MKQEIRYIELKSGFGTNGPAWIGLVEYSKSGQTIYFNNTALKKLKTLVFQGIILTLKQEKNTGYLV